VEGPIELPVNFFTQSEHRGAIGVNVKSTQPVPQEQIFSIVLGFWQARALAVATELGLPDLLAEGPLHVDELASRTKTNASALFRLLRSKVAGKGIA
jgi:Dimerisation domain